jgi:hypothetical protein
MKGRQAGGNGKKHKLENWAVFCFDDYQKKPLTDILPA